MPIPDDPKINGLGAFPICCWDARPPQSAAKVVLGTHKVLASGEGGWVFGVLCVLGAPLCERVSMLRMPDPIHPDLPCLFACATVPALCSVVIPDACRFKRTQVKTRCPLGSARVRASSLKSRSMANTQREKRPADELSGFCGGVNIKKWRKEKGLGEKGIVTLDFLS